MTAIKPRDDLRSTEQRAGRSFSECYQCLGAGLNEDRTACRVCGGIGQCPYLLLDPPKLKAGNAREFHELLGEAMVGAALKPGQIAMKTGISRSQVYNMINPRRATVPRQEKHVVDFLRACKIDPLQVGTIVSLWKSLRTAAKYEDVLVALPNAETMTSASGDSSALVNVGHAVNVRPTQSHRPRTFFDVVHFVLVDEDRSRRAARLLAVLAAAYLGVLGVIGYLLATVTACGRSAWAPVLIALLAILVVAPFVLANRLMRSPPSRREERIPQGDSVAASGQPGR